MFYFKQKIKLKSKSGEFVFIRENECSCVFVSEGKEVMILKSDLGKSEVVELWESVKLFGRTPIKRLLRVF